MPLYFMEQTSGGQELCAKLRARPIHTSHLSLLQGNLDFYWGKHGHCCYSDVLVTHLAGLEPKHHMALTNQVKYLLFFANLESRKSVD